MNKDWNEYVLKRCGEALEEDKTYMEMEQSGQYSQDELQAKAEVLCYLKCMKDMLAIYKM